MTENNLRLSIIIACFNYESFVGRAIESVLSQCGETCELLVVDDGSSDRSWEVIRSYGLTHAYRVPNGGAAKACFFAFQRARAPFVLFLDADDELAPGALAEILSRLDPGVAKLQFALTPIDANGTVLGAPTPVLRDERRRTSLMREVARTGAYNSPPTSGNVFCRALCALLADVDYEMSVDGVTLFAAPFFGDVVSVRKPLGYYRLHRHNYSQAGSRPTAHRFRKEAERFVARHEHLGQILAERRDPVRLRAARDLFFYRERTLYADLLEGRRPNAAGLLSLQWLTLTSRARPTYRLAMLLFLSACFCFPNRSLRAALEYRFRPGRRSAFGLARSLFARPAPLGKLLDRG